ncbi:MAG: VWA domain-containing protein [Acidobacteriota bacterium]
MELIIDASGSMKHDFPEGSGTSRFQVAKRIFEDVVEKDLPNNLPVSLRVFGHKELVERKKNRCATELVMPRGRYSKRDLVDRIHGLQAQGDTALGHSIADAAKDLAGVSGPKIVLLVTDGYETCKGNPLKAAESLPDDVHLNIVGYAIGKDEHKKDFEKWAAAGNGRYFDAAHPDQLDKAIRHALRPPYRVIDPNGNVVARGVVDGDLVEVPPGEYQIRLALEDDVIEHVKVAAGQLTSYSIRRTRERLEEFKDQGGIWVHTTGAAPRGEAKSMRLPTDWTVELILDASGSMDTKFPEGHSTTRFDVAKEIFQHVIEDDLPEYLPVALRAFGHEEVVDRENDFCATELVLSRERFSKEKLIGTIRGLDAKGKTALAASIEDVGKDLAGVSGPKIVLLVTDGAETCKGNPSRAIQDLVREVEDVHVHIVGYAIENDAHRKQFEKWAEDGHGRYFDAAHRDSLDDALRQAFKIPYKVVNGNGSVYATGFVDGDPVDVPPGEYQIQLALEGDIIEHVKVGPDRLTSYSIRRTRERLEEFEDAVEKPAPSTAPSTAGAGARRCLHEARSSGLPDLLGREGTAALCRNAKMENPVGPIECFAQLWDYRDDLGAFQEQIDREDEPRQLVVAVCQGSVDAGGTTECFLELAFGGNHEEIAEEIAGGAPWRGFVRDIHRICSDR